MRRITYECCIRSGKRQKYGGEHALFNSSDVAIRTLDSKGPCSDGSIRINVKKLYENCSSNTSFKSNDSYRDVESNCQEKKHTFSEKLPKV